MLIKKSFIIILLILISHCIVNIGSQRSNCKERAHHKKVTLASPLNFACESFILEEMRIREAPYESTKEIIRNYQTLYLLECLKYLQMLKECEKKSKYIPDIYIE
ncbi:MAG: hypothetical protein KatS3mg002_1719 [Candidatus Woesearchaeota archaeon]|nr:MAG: hypothetical protein KatS3mg002_1719 [Candidatus Woesearchaeota archaeon]